uniref:Growth hormone releasing hormone receptor a n=1 Tax=Sphaeramia orbicularis TaxID=375764 RepID=A0A672YTF6_9TELE
LTCPHLSSVLTCLLSSPELCPHLSSPELCPHLSCVLTCPLSSPELCCPTHWDDIRCWTSAEVGQVVNVSCTDVSQLFDNNQGSVSRSCTEDGWSDVQPAYEDACAFAEHEEDDPQTTYFSNFRQVYTAGYATSLASLISAIFVFAAFRKFHCTRNYIHINLFLSFILRASAVFIKDRVLFSDEDLDHCFMSTPSCKAAVAFFHFSILANYFWLLVEGLYLQTLLALTFVFHNKFFWCYLLIGWGLPTSIITAWILSRNFYDDRGCWDDTDVSFIWWIIKAPITASLLVSPEPDPDLDQVFRSTLLLIPLFGMHYMVFAFLPENTGTDARIFIELGLGSFQGFVVALLYCFLNGEVSGSQLHNNYTTTTQQQCNTTKHKHNTNTVLLLSICVVVQVQMQVVSC